MAENSNISFSSLEEPLSEATFRFTIENFSNFKTTLLSPPLYIHNIPWRIMIMPRYNRTQSSHEVKGLGYFLQCGLDVGNSNWSCTALAELRLLNQKDPDAHFSRRCEHVFFNQENDWGFSHYIGWDELSDPEKGFLKDDSIVLETWMTLLEPPNGVSSLCSKENSAGDNAASSSEGNPSSSFAIIPSLAGYIWTIKDFGSENLGEIKSSTFISDLSATSKWHLKICHLPSATATSATAFKDQMSIELVLNSCSPKEFKAIFTLNLKTKNGKIIKSFEPVQIFSGPPSSLMNWGWNNIKINKIIDKVNDSEKVLVVDCLVKTYSKQKSFEDLMHSLKCTSSDLLLALKSDKFFTDITLESMEGKEIQAHKFILAVRSPVFSAMFNHNMIEKRESRVKIADLKYDTLALLISFFYTTTLPKAPEDEYFNLIYAANKYELPYLTSLIEEELIKNIRDDNAIHLLVLSDIHKGEKLKQALLKYVCLDHSRELCEMEEWNEIISSHPHLLNECFRFLTKTRKRPSKGEQQNKVDPPVDLFQFLAEDSCFTDVTLVSKDGKELKAHKAFLAASSPSFNEMFLSGPKGTENKAFIYDVDFSTLTLMLEFAYRGTLTNLSPEDGMNLIRSADRYQFLNLKALMEDYLISSITVENASRLLALAHQCNAQKLKKSAIVFISWEAPEEVVETEGWKELLLSDTHLINECFKSLCNPQENCLEIFTTFSNTSVKDGKEC